MSSGSRLGLPWLEPFLERAVAAAVLLVPAEQCLAARYRDGADQVADVGQEAVGFRHAVAVDREMLAGQRRLAERLGQLPGVAEAARQLVRAEEEIGQRDARAGAEDVRAEMHGERLERAFGQRAGGDREA